MSLLKVPASLASGASVRTGLQPTLDRSSFTRLSTSASAAASEEGDTGFCRSGVRSGARDSVRVGALSFFSFSLFSGAGLAGFGAGAFVDGLAAGFVGFAGLVGSAGFTGFARF